MPNSGTTFAEFSKINLYQCDPDDRDHIVLLTGMDVSTNAYTIKNSWGSSWGESGYFRLCGGSDECGVGDEVAYPKGCYSN